ncbi:heparinase II/III family protein [bacterium]|nr:heparinase II/III family protein [bacterium]
MNKLRLGIVLLVLVLAAGQVRAADSGAPALQDATWSEDFENGTSCGWDSYPAFEDTAFDFTLISGRFLPRYHLQGYLQSGEFFYPVGVTPPGNDSANTRYLLRNLRPNSASSQLIGVVQKFPNLYAGAGTNVEFDYWLQLPHGKNALRVELAGGDGQRYQTVINDLKVQEWVRAKLPVSAFKSKEGAMADGTQIQALVIAAEIERGNPSEYVFVGVDNVKINGKARVGFKLTTPVSTAYKNWEINFLDRQYSPGQTLAIEAESDGGALEGVTASLKTYDGKVLANNVALTGGPEKFSATSAYQFTKENLGPLTLTIEGKKSDGSVARTDFRMWNITPVPSSHPRVMIKEADKDRVAALMRTPEWNKTLPDVIRNADGVMAGLRNGRPNTNPGGSGDAPPKIQSELLPTDYLFATNENIIPANIFRRFCDRIEPAAWAYYYTGDRKYGDWAKKQMMNLIQWDTWISPWFEFQGRPFYYPAGQGTEELAVAYDLIRPLLSDTEAAQVRQAIFEKGIKKAWTEWFENNRVPFSTSNWIAHSMASPHIALMAIMNEGRSEFMNQYGEPYFSTTAEKVLEMAHRTMRPDGGWGEDYSYQDYANQAAQRWLYAAANLLGAEDLAEQLNYTKGHLFPMYMTVMTPSRSVLSMGDSFDRPVPGLNFTWECGKSTDPSAHWFRGKQGASNLEMLMSSHLLNVPPKSPAELGMPLGRVFPLKGNAVFRTGWDPDSALINFRAGPWYNHTHVDMGNFRFVAFGKEVATESGHVEYYGDPWFWGFFTQAGGHNCMLVDDNNESQYPGDFDSEVKALKDSARMTAWVAGDGVSFATANLAPVYKNPMKAYERRMYFVAPGYVVFNDRIRSADGDHSFHWQVYPPAKENLKVEGTAAQVVVDDVTMQVAVASPENARLIVKDVPIPVAEYGGFPKKKMDPRAVLQIVNAQPADSADFVVALLPHKSAGAAWKSTPLQGRGYKGIRIEGEGKVDTICFAADGKISGDVATDGASAFARSEGGRITMAAVENAKTLKVDGKPVLESQAPVSASCIAVADGMKWSFNSPLGGTVRVIDASGNLKTVNVRQGESTQIVK